MDSRDLSQVELLVEIVGEKINAQVAAHEKYSQAFIKILDTLDNIIEQQDELGSGDTLFFKKLIEDISDLSKDIKEEDELQKKWRESMIDKLDTYKNTNEKNINNLQEKIENSVKNANNSFDELSEKITKLIEKVEFLSENNDESHKEMGSQLSLLMESRKKFSKTLEKVIIYFAAIASVIGIIMGLMQLNLVNITWGSKP